MQSYTHFTLLERESLRIKLTENKSIRQIAKEMSRSPSTISRELSRNKNKDGSYHPWRATVLYICRRKNSWKPFRIEHDAKLKEWTEKCLDQYWSPEIIAAKWNQENPEVPCSPSTIYRAIKKGKLSAQYTPKTHLIRHGRRKNSHQSSTIHPDHFIHERPCVIENRSRIGDWEGDTLHGGINKGYLVTCVDRKTRYLAAVKTKSKHNNTVNEAFFKALKGFDVHSITLDNGSEFGGFKEIQKELNTTVYFADPHSPWQRGSNENINGLLRCFFPKDTDFLSVSEDHINNVVNLINHRPRKCLGWLSPADLFFSKCCT